MLITTRLGKHDRAVHCGFVGANVDGGIDHARLRQDCVAMDLVAMPLHPINANKAAFFQGKEYGGRARE